MTLASASRSQSARGLVHRHDDRDQEVAGRFGQAFAHGGGGRAAGEERGRVRVEGDALRRAAQGLPGGGHKQRDVAADETPGRAREHQLEAAARGRQPGVGHIAAVQVGQTCADRLAIADGLDRDRLVGRREIDRPAAGEEAIDPVQVADVAGRCRPQIGAAAQAGAILYPNVDQDRAVEPGGEREVEPGASVAEAGRGDIRPLLLGRRGRHVHTVEEQLDAHAALGMRRRDDPAAHPPRLGGLDEAEMGERLGGHVKRGGQKQAAHHRLQGQPVGAGRQAIDGDVERVGAVAELGVAVSVPDAVRHQGHGQRGPRRGGVAGQGETAGDPALRVRPTAPADGAMGGEIERMVEQAGAGLDRDHVQQAAE